MTTSTPARFLTARAVYSLLLLSPLLAGCWNDGAPREAIVGTVTLDEQPLDQGTILFTPLLAGPSASTGIKEGSYHIPQELGPSPGTYRVDIRAYRAKGIPLHDEATGVTEQVMESIIPPRYNRGSTLEVEVVHGAVNRFDFKLQSR